MLACWIILLKLLLVWRKEPLLTLFLIIYFRENAAIVTNKNYAEKVNNSRDISFLFYVSAF